MTTQKKKILEIRDLHTYYGSIHALKGIDLDVYEGELVTLIGSNGAGKSTTLGSITGIVPASKGKILFEGKDITKMKPSDITKLGIGVSPEGREVFGGLSVEENLKIGAYTRKDPKEIAASFQEIYELFPRLAERKKQSAGTLSGGEQQRIAIARALASHADVILADEPTGNLDTENGRNIISILKRLAHEGDYCVIVVTHDMEIANEADVVLRMSDGKIE